MIDQIKGYVEHKKATSIVLFINDFGLKILMSKISIDLLPLKKEKTRILTYLHVREDILDLYGFHSDLERDTFMLLISISGIGPKLALTILSGIEPSRLSSHIIDGNIKALTAISGVGGKTAKRIIIELKDKFIKVDNDSLGIEEGSEKSKLFEDTFNALMTLGYKSSHAKEACLKLEKEGELNGPVEIVIKKALTLLIS